MVLGELLLSRFRLREAGFAGFLAAQVGLVGPDRMRFVTIFLGLHFMFLITNLYCLQRGLMMMIIPIVTWSEAKSILSS